MTTLENVKSQALIRPDSQQKIDPAVMRKLEEILDLMKDNSTSKALVRAGESYATLRSSIWWSDTSNSRHETCREVPDNRVCE